MVTRPIHYPSLDMLSTLIPWVLLLPGLIVRGNWSCPGDKSIAEQHHTFEKYNMLISATIHLPFNLVVLFELMSPELDAPPIHITVGIQLALNQVSELEPPHFALCGDNLKAAGRGPFVVAVVDPDASPPNLAQPGHQGVHAFVNRTPALSGFLDPQLPAGPGLHR
ncbi:hypothetical protein V8E53_003971, partial [Lactarius tabidus]